MEQENEIQEQYKPKGYRLRAMPKDIYEAVIKEQAAMKARCNCQRNIESAFYSLIRKAVQQ